MCTGESANIVIDFRENDRVLGTTNYKHICRQIWIATYIWQQQNILEVNVIFCILYANSIAMMQFSHI